ncbi:hypothetical protein Csa_012028 [Cucumis sativus]|uniref:Uncharacterized protein n=1 Tax=Cucumis sativus TaxID=3659 RepID=A0A0A0L3K8_CUCSA|nr:hypothetical protein Csa_012028 [Cucumis sativus]
MNVKERTVPTNLLYYVGNDSPDMNFRTSFPTLKRTSRNLVPTRFVTIPDVALHQETSDFL